MIQPIFNLNEDPARLAQSSNIPELGSHKPGAATTTPPSGIATQIMPEDEGLRTAMLSGSGPEMTFLSNQVYKGETKGGLEGGIKAGLDPFGFF